MKTGNDVADAGSRDVSAAAGNTSQRISERPKIDKSVLTISEPKRIRPKEHLRFVARQPCLVCGRSPSHAHHIRYAQSRGLSLEVSDEFTVPLCAIHHRENHASGNEKAWWEQHKLGPLQVAKALWREGRMLPSHPEESSVDLSATGPAPGNDRA